MNIARNLVPLAAAAILLFITAQLHLDAWLAIGIAQILALGIAAIVAWRMHAKPAFAVLAVFFAAVAAELAAHVVYGIRAVQGGATHITIFAAALLGVILGACVTTNWRRGTAASVRPAPYAES
jgi:hypothetical protein